MGIIHELSPEDLNGQFILQGSDRESLFFRLADDARKALEGAPAPTLPTKLCSKCRTPFAAHVAVACAQLVKHVSERKYERIATGYMVGKPYYWPHRPDDCIANLGDKLDSVMSRVETLERIAVAAI